MLSFVAEPALKFWAGWTLLPWFSHSDNVLDIIKAHHCANWSPWSGEIINANLPWERITRHQQASRGFPFCGILAKCSLQDSFAAASWRKWTFGSGSRIISFQAKTERKSKYEKLLENLFNKRIFRPKNIFLKFSKIMAYMRTVKKYLPSYEQICWMISCIFSSQSLSISCHNDQYWREKPGKSTINPLNRYNTRITLNTEPDKQKAAALHPNTHRKSSWSSVNSAFRGKTRQLWNFAVVVWGKVDTRRCECFRMGRNSEDFVWRFDRVLQPAPWWVILTARRATLLAICRFDSTHLKPPCRCRQPD